MEKVSGVILSAVALWFLGILVFAEKPWAIADEIVGREAEGKLLMLRHHVTLGLYWAAGINLAILVVVLATWRLWSDDLSPIRQGFAWADPSPRSWVFWLLLLLIVAGGVTVRSKLAARSLWWDELWTVKQAVVGSWVQDGSANTKIDGSEGAEGRRDGLKFRAVSWSRSAWYYQKPTNHSVASLSAKLAYETFGTSEEKAAGEFREWVIRLPMLFCSALSIFLAGVLGRRWGGTFSGILAATVLALHPWHIRYGIDARAYAFIVLWAFMGCWWLGRLFREGNSNWLYWWGFGLNQFLIVWTFPQAVFLAGGFALAAAVLVPFSWGVPRDRWVAWGRWAVVNAVAAVMFFQVFAPNLNQMREWLSDDLKTQGDGLNGEQFAEFMSQMSFGLPAKLPDTPEALGLPAFDERMADLPALGWVLMVGGGLAFFLGLARLAMRDLKLVLVPGSVLLAGVGSLLFFWFSQGFFYHRFMIFLIVPVVLLPAIGLDGLGRMGLPRGWAKIPGLVGLLLFLWFVIPQVGVLWERDYTPLRRVAAVFKGAGDEAIVVGYGHGAEVLPVYEPRMRFVTSRKELDELGVEARQESKRLLVAYGHRDFNLAIVPDGFELLDDPEQYVELIAFPGIEPNFYFRVLEWSGTAPKDRSVVR